MPLDLSGPAKQHRLIQPGSEHLKSLSLNIKMTFERECTTEAFHTFRQHAVFVRKTKCFVAFFLCTKKNPQERQLSTRVRFLKRQSVQCLSCSVSHKVWICNKKMPIVQN